MNPMEHELLVNQAATGLSPKQFDEFRRLARALAAHEKRWGLFLLKYEHTDDRRRVADAINKLIPRNATLVVSENAHPDWPSLEQAICQVAQTADVVQLFDLDAWLDTSVEPKRAEARLRSWNVRREGFAADVAVPVICWLRPATLKSLAVTAPDLWSWRAAVQDFCTTPRTDTNMAEMMVPFTESIDNRSLAQRTLRLREIEQYLQQHPAQDEQQLKLTGLLIIEMAEIYTGLGELDEAQRLYRNKAIPIFRKLNDERNLAIINGKIVEILIMHRELDEALSIVQNEILPFFAQSGNLHDIAITHEKIAEIMEAHNEYSTALTILREKVLPIFKHAGDNRAYASALCKIASIHSVRGEFADALHIYRNEAIPLFEKIGDVRNRAAALSNSANILQERGELAAALLAFRQALPIFEKLGDVRAHAVALGNIANILQARGEYAEALRICQEVLAVFEKIGDKRAIAISQNNIQAILNKSTSAK